MNFLNLGMLAGALAFIVPLAIHLLFRSRYRSLDWGAMFLLKDVVAQNRRRMQWHQWILLALRCAIPILLALAMARPLLSSARALPGSEPLTLVLLLDDSRSMQAAGRHDRAFQAASGLIENLSRRDEVILVTTSRLEEAFERSSPRDALAKLSECTFNGPPSDYTTTLRVGLDACQEASHPNRRIVLCGDFQTNCLPSSNRWLESVDEIRGQLDRMTPSPRVDLLNVSGADDALDNLLVESIETTSPAVLKDRSVQFIASVRNDSDRAISRIGGRWLLNGQSVQTDSIDLAPRSTARVAFTHVPDQSGNHSIAFAVEHTDAIAADNRRRLAWNALEQIQVWLVDGAPSNEPLESETDFLRLALSPFAFATVDQHERADLVSSRVLSPSNWKRELRKHLDTASRPDVIVFANLQKSTLDRSDDRDLLQSFFASDGQVVFFDGEQVSAESWNQMDWLPAKLDRLITSSDVQQVLDDTVEVTADEQLDLGFSILPPRGRQSVWGSLQDAGDAIWEEVRVGRYRRLQLDPSTAETTSILLRTADQAPLVVRRGPVIQFAIGCDAEWSTFPLRAIYLPMMQQLFLDLVGDQESLNVTAGDPMLLPRTGSAWKVTLPDGTQADFATPSDLQTVNDSEPNLSLRQFASTDAPGIYQFQPAESGGEQETSDSSLIRVAEIPAEESNLRGLESDQIETFAERIDARLFATPDALVEATASDRFGQEVWRPLMALVLLVLIAELLWQQFAGRPKSSIRTWTRPIVSTQGRS
ncbi:BatA domain-containing protein [Rhodopirellula sp. JC740]|uniref:BatA domain-containing protein n=1 Tax=Rhodopirellula halodulae TaxID=2894198 RepID=A0ABS8ND23_9BACT|nr:BatA domain-containing protein [Rhodopirellula sp. JC740]MCC9641444.1 BatA domain-containing protein [Rhodopirellula sp. JC740]